MAINILYMSMNSESTHIGGQDHVETIQFPFKGQSQIPQVSLFKESFISRPFDSSFSTFETHLCSTLSHSEKVLSSKVKRQNVGCQLCLFLL